MKLTEHLLNLNQEKLRTIQIFTHSKHTKFNI